MSSSPNLSALLWSVADLLRGDYKQADYGKVILPFTVLRRLDCVLAETKAEVLAELAARGPDVPDAYLLRRAKQAFYNRSPLDLGKALGDQDNLAENLLAYVAGFSPAVREIFTAFDLGVVIERLNKAGLLYLVTQKFVNVNLHPRVVDNAQMGTVFEELIRKFAEISDETAGEHFTPREVIKLMVNLLFVEDDSGAVQARRGAVAVRPHGRHRRHALGGGRAPARAQPRRPPRDVRPGAQP